MVVTITSSRFEMTGWSRSWVKRWAWRGMEEGSGVGESGRRLVDRKVYH
jgi:hypothetical protein